MGSGSRADGDAAAYKRIPRSDLGADNLLLCRCYSAVIPLLISLRRQSVRSEEVSENNFLGRMDAEFVAEISVERQERAADSRRCRCKAELVN